MFLATVTAIRNVHVAGADPKSQLFHLSKEQTLLFVLELLAS